jgi:hypothetical protein
MQEDKDVTQGYMDHMKKVNKGEVNKYPMRGKGKPLSQARKDALFGKKKKDADYVEERVVANPGRPEKSTYIPDPELANLRLKDIPSQYDKRKAYRDNPNEDIGGEESVTNQRSQRILNLIRAKNPTAKNDFEAVLLSLDKAKKNLSNDDDEAAISALRQDLDELRLIVNQLKNKQSTVGESVAGPDKCWDGYKPGNPKTKAGTGKNAGKRVNNCVPV